MIYDPVFSMLLTLAIDCLIYHHRQYQYFLTPDLPYSVYALNPLSFFELIDEADVFVMKIISAHHKTDAIGYDRSLHQRTARWYWQLPVELSLSRSSHGFLQADI